MIIAVSDVIMMIIEPSITLVWEDSILLAALPEVCFGHIAVFACIAHGTDGKG